MQRSPYEKWSTLRMFPNPWSCLENLELNNHVLYKYRYQIISMDENYNIGIDTGVVLAKVGKGRTQLLFWKKRKVFS